MLYLKEINDIVLLEVELKRLKLLYSDILKGSERQPLLNQLRNRIKHISRQINILEQKAAALPEVHMSV